MISGLLWFWWITKLITHVDCCKTLPTSHFISSKVTHLYWPFIQYFITVLPITTATFEKKWMLHLIIAPSVLLTNIVLYFLSLVFKGMNGLLWFWWITKLITHVDCCKTLPTSHFIWPLTLPNMATICVHINPCTQIICLTSTLF
jgi:hypothetical protein